jgi:TPP-dependent pyruvate/acetoin dehydrogenase alpha subunit
MPEFDAHVLVCTAVTGDNNHCGDKAGPAVREKFNEMLQKHGLIGKVNVSATGCTSQHRYCEGNQCSITIYGPGAANGGTWYITTVDDVEEIVTKHLVGGQKLESLRNERLGTKLS